MRIYHRAEQPPQGLWLAPALFISGVLLWKLGYLVVSIGAAQPVLSALTVVANDCLLLVVMGALLLVEQSTRGWMRRSLQSIVICLSFWFYIDTSIIVAADDRLTLANLFRFGGELSVVTPFLSWGHIAVIIVFLLALPLRVPALEQLQSKVTALILCTLPALLVYFGVSANSSLLARYRTDFGATWHLTQRPSRELLFEQPYSPEEISRWQKSELFEVRRFDGAPPNIIVLVIEGFSSFMSQRISGLRNLVPQFDHIAQEGTLFLNYFANSDTSEAAHASLLSGLLPLRSFGVSGSIYEAFKGKPTVLSAVRQQFANDAYLTNAPLSDLRKPHFFSQLGFRHLCGFECDPRYAQARSPRLTFAPDELLYQSVLEWVDRQAGKGSALAVAVTASSHQPYRDPLGRGDTPENVWSYVDSALAHFYEQLKARDFFASGVLLITGDHREMIPMQEAELSRFGDSAYNRVPLLVLGAGVARNTTDIRALQHADLLAKLADLRRPTLPLSNHIIVNNWREHAPYGQPAANIVKVYEPSSDYRRGSVALIKGRTIQWLESAPEGRAEIERRIHAERARTQYTEAPVLRPCKPPRTAGGRSSAVHGLRADVYSTIEISDEASMQGSRLIASEIVDRLNFFALGEGELGPKIYFSAKFTGFLKIPEGGDYWLRVESDDGFCLFLDGDEVLNGNFDHGTLPFERQLYLERGTKSFQLRYYQRGFNGVLRFSWIPPGEQEWQTVPPDAFLLDASS